MSQAITRTANAKINIGLHIMGRRTDGYHLMETLYYPVPELADTVHLARTEGKGCTVEMRGLDAKVAAELKLENNLCYRAWQMMADRFGIEGVEMQVEKRIPAGAGLGGGSSDAAATLLGLRDLFGLEVGEDELAEMGEKLGADVPFFVYNRPLYATGIGTVFEDYAPDLSDYRVEVVTSPYFSSTPAAFKGLRLEKIQHQTALKTLLEQPLA
ncbi:MAG: 4-(cytidine 5'-diphospho)-2-C-methyl-D-erythritol kinase, partial [Bacteroidota bacterium]